MSLADVTKQLTERLNKHAEFNARDRPASVPPPPPVELTPERIVEVKTIVLKSNAILSLLQLNGITPHEIGRMFDAARGKR